MSSLRQCCGSGSGIRCLFDPWIRDEQPGSYFRDQGWKKFGSGILDKHPGSATLVFVKRFGRKYRNMRSKIAVPTTATNKLNRIPHLIILVKGHNILVPKTASKIINYSQKITQTDENLRVNARRCDISHTGTIQVINIILITRRVHLWQNALRT